MRSQGEKPSGREGGPGSELGADGGHLESPGDSGVFRVMVENSQDLLCVLRQDGTIGFCSPSIHDLLGYEPHEVTGRPIFSLIHPDELEMARDALATAADRPGMARYAKVRLRRSDGSWRVHEVSSRNLLHDPEVRGLVINSRDVTERYEAERLISAQRDLSVRLGRLEDTEEALRVSLHAVIDASGLDSGGIYVLDDDTGGFRLAYHVGLSESFVELIRAYGPDSPHTALVKSGQAAYLDYRQLPVPKEAAHLAEGLKAVAVVPIMYEGKAVGCVNLGSHVEEEIAPRTRRVIEAMLGHIGEALVRIRLQRELRASERHYRTLIERSHDVVLILDHDGRILYHSPSLERILATHGRALEGAVLFELVHPDDLASLREGLDMCCGEREAVGREARLRRSDGSWRRLECICTDLHDDPAVGGLLVNARDITEQAEAENALAESRRAFQTLLGNLPGMAYRCRNDPSWTMLFVSEGSVGLTGYRPEELVGKGAVSYAELVHPQDRDMVWDAVQRALAAGEHYKLTYRIRTAAGEERWVWEQGQGVGRDEEGTAILEGFITDITEKKVYERKLEEYAERMRDFMDIAAHELRHPATLLKGYASTISSRGENLPPEALAASLQGIEVGADRLVYVVEELLDATRIQRGGFALELKPTDVVRAAAEALREIGMRYPKTTFISDLPEGSVVTHADADRLLRLFVILLDNAVKNSPPEQPIELRGRMEGGEMLFSVLDRGPGIPEEESEKVFRRFYQVGGALHHGGPGLGLGLYIGKRIVEEHGGRIWHRPREGGGSVFSFTIPLGERGDS